MSIQEHLNKIRNAVYGREVRESIAKGIEVAYDDASENGNANMEVKIARGTHPNLRSRLEEVDDKQQQTTAQLAQTDYEARRKKEPEDLSERTLSLMTGEGTIELLSVPQENSVNDSKMLDIETVPATVNLFDKNKRIQGGSYNRYGEWGNSPVVDSTEFIPVTAGETYKSNGNTSAYVIWDKDRNPITGNRYTTTYPTTEDTAYLTVAVNREHLGEIMITKEDEMPETYVPYKWDIKSSVDNRKKINELNERVTDVLYFRTNLFDKDAMITGGHFNRYGEWSSSSSFHSSGFISVEGGKVYKTYGSTGAYALWDKNKEHVGGEYNYGDIITTTTDTVYLTVAIDVSDKDNVMISREDEEVTGYVPYDYLEIKTDRLERKIENDLTLSNVLNKKISESYTEPINLPVTDFSGYNEPYHPSVIYIESGFGGYNYWMVQSPYPFGSPRSNRWEMPVVYKSHDGIDWVNVADPLDDLTEQDIADGNFFSDPHILFREDTQTLEVWYRFTDRSGDQLTGLYRKTTTDGVNWTEREELFEPGLSYRIDSIRSQSVIWDNENNQYRMWYLNSFNDGVHYKTSSDAHTWSEGEPMVLDIPHAIWHGDVNYYNDKYHLISYSAREQNLVYYVSEDNKNYYRQRTILDMKDGHSLYSRGLYRAISMLDGDGNVRLYFSGDDENRRRNINVMIAESLYEMNGVQKIDGNHVVISDSGMTLNDLAIELQHIKKNQ